MEWIQEPLILEGSRVVLRPMQEEHFDALVTAAKNERIWTFIGYDGTDSDTLRKYLNEGLRLRNLKQQYPFTVFNKATGEIIGTTRLGDISLAHNTLEIGWTWYIPELWGKGYNEECKLLLLTYCFGQLKANRVQLKTSDTNLRSRRAIERIGATFEGILRSHMVREDGTVRNTALFSIIKEEWPDRKARLRKLVEEKYALL